MLSDFHPSVHASDTRSGVPGPADTIDPHAVGLAASLMADLRHAREIGDLWWAAKLDRRITLLYRDLCGREVAR